MYKLQTKTCRLCEGIICHPMLMVVPSVAGAASGNSGRGEKLLVAARMKCTCREGIRAEYERDGADLSGMADRVRLAIYKGIERIRGGIPVIDPDAINSSDHLVFVVGFDKKIINNWLALDLIPMETFYEYIRDNKVSVEKVWIPG